MNKFLKEFKDRGYFYQCTSEGELSNLLDKKNQCVKCNNIAKERRYDCPECGEMERSVFCNICEIHSVSCYNCSNLILLGERCTECDVENEGITCIRCSFKGGIREWTVNNG